MSTYSVVGRCRSKGSTGSVDGRLVTESFPGQPPFYPRVLFTVLCGTLEEEDWARKSGRKTPKKGEVLKGIINKRI